MKYPYIKNHILILLKVIKNVPQIPGIFYSSLETNLKKFAKRAILIQNKNFKQFSYSKNKIAFLEK